MEKYTLEKCKTVSYVDEADLELSHRQVTRAIWNARLPTEFIRRHFILCEKKSLDEQVQRFYKITSQGVEAIRSYIEKEQT